MENQQESNPSQMSQKDENLWATLSHLGVIAGFIIPFGNILTPLIIWLIQREKSDYVGDHAKEALNFQISVSILAFACGILIFLVVGVPLLIALMIFSLVVSIIAAIRANKGEMYKYPLNFRLIK
jgi:uncharacterized Tic20 family protein